MRDGDWCVPVKHVAKLNRMRGSTSTETNIKFFVDPEEEDRDNDATSDCLGSKQFSLKDDVSHKCSCCEADGMQRRRKRNLTLRFSSLTDADINFFEKGNTDLNELQQNTWAPLPKPLVVDSGAGETVMPVDWLTSHPLTECDGSRANDFYTTADGSKVYNEGQRKLDVCTLDGQQRRSMTFQVARAKKALGSVSQMVKNWNKLAFLIKISCIQNKRTNEKILLRQENGIYVLDLMVALPQCTDPHFSPAGIAFMTLVSPIETQLRKVIPELCVNDVPERVAEVEMSSSNPVRGDPLPDWLQPFHENLVDEEEQRGDRLEEYVDIQDDDQEREGVVAHGERARPLPQTRLPSRQEVQEHELTHIPCRSWCVHCVRGAGRSAAHRRRARQSEEGGQHTTTWSSDCAFMIDNGDVSRQSSSTS